MKKLLTILVFLLPYSSYAQQLKGFVNDPSGHPLDGATISLSQQSKNIAYALADSGKFNLNYKQNGTYLLTSTLIGYKPFQRVIELPKDTANIVMEPDVTSLSGVAITATKPVIERKIDRVTFNVENSIVASGGTAWDALSKAPGVQAKPDNSISAYKKGVQVYMDGKPLHLSGDDLANYLQGLPSSTIAKIEVFSNPPASFDAEGGAVINIITKKTKISGLNVSLNGGYTQATYGSYNGSATFNYRRDKLNIYGSYGYTTKHYEREHHDYVTYATPTNTSFWDSPGLNEFNAHTNNYRLGADYQLTDNQVIGFLVTGTNRTGSILTNTPTTVTSANKSAIDSTLITKGSTASSNNRYAYNLNYNLKIVPSGNSLNVDVDYSPYKSNLNQIVDNVSYLPDGTANGNPYHIKTPTVQEIDIYSGKLDYNYKLGKTLTLTSGLKYSSIQSQNNFDFYDNAGTQPVLVAANSDHFKYTENTAAAYTSMNASFGKWTLAGGLRGELTHTSGYSETLDTLNKKQYFKLFPTLYAVYKINDNNELQFTYSYRVERPVYPMLNPAKHYATPYNYLVGNPALQPAFIQNVEVGYTFKGDYTFTAYYSAVHGMASNITVQDNAQHLFYDTFQNLGLSVNTGARIDLAFHPASWWDMNATIAGYYEKEKSTYLGGSYDYRKFAYDATTTQSFTINKKMGLKAEISAYYNSPGIQGIFKVGVNSDVDAGIKTNVLKGKGTLKLSVNDIFYSNTYRLKVNYMNQNNGFFQSNDTRSAALTFSYKFGKNVAASRARKTASEEEKNRAQ